MARMRPSCVALAGTPSLPSPIRRWRNLAEVEFFMPDMQARQVEVEHMQAEALRLLQAIPLWEAIATLDMWASSLSPMEKRRLALRSRELTLSRLLHPMERQWQMDHLPR